MYTENYLSYLLERNDEIIIDTSAMMKNDAMRSFVERAEDLLLSYNKKLIVPASVQMELEKFLKGDNEEKKKKAAAAFILMDTFYYLFCIEPKMDMESCYFADPALLSRLTLKKSEYRQLLIANDKDLATDAFRINQQESNKGRTIMVCYLNDFGCLCRCECTKSVAESEVPRRRAEVKYIETEKIVYVPVEEKDTSNIGWKLPAAFFGGAVSAVVIKEYAWPLLKKTLAA